MPDLTPRQLELLDYIHAFQAEHEISPSIPDICAHFGFASPRAAAKHLERLQQQGAIARTHGARRGIRIVGGVPSVKSANSPSLHASPPQTQERSRLVAVPFMGRIAAGAPLSSGLEAAADHLEIDPSLFNVVPDFLHEVSGYSMVNVGILPGDKVGTKRSSTVPNHSIVTAVITGQRTGDPEFTIKRLERSGADIILHSENDDLESYPPLRFLAGQDAIEILGRYCGLIRSIAF
jgi:repressor LexA